MDPTPDLILFCSDFKDAKEIIFSYNLPAGTLSADLNIKFFAKMLCEILFCKHYFSPLTTFMRKANDPDPEPNPYPCL
jgi:hypothetical protein